MIHRLPDGQAQATALNFSNRHITGQAGSEHFAVGDRLIDLWNHKTMGQIGTDRMLNVALEPHAGISLLLTPAERRGR